MAVYFCISSSLLSPFRTSHHVGFSDPILSYINDPHSAFKGEHYARNAQRYCEGATSIKGIECSDPRIRDATLDRLEVLS